MNPATIRLTLNPELRTILDSIKQAYPLLEYSEIIRMALSTYYQKFQEQQIDDWEKKLLTRKATTKEEKSIAKGIDDVAKGHFTTIQAGDTKVLKKILGIAK